jgi:hypothetical protein
VLPKDGQLPVPPRRVIILEEDLEVRVGGDAYAGKGVCC